MAKILPQPGTYGARRDKPMVTYESDSGSLCVAVHCELVGADVAFKFKHTLTIATPDGAPKTKVIDTLKSIWPDWDGNPFTLKDIPINEGDAEFELADCYHDDSYTPADATEPVIQFKAQWFNALGGSSNMPEEADEAVQNKWAAKFKAGGKPAAKPATKPAAKPAAAPAKSTGAPPPRKSTGTVARTSTQEEVWQALKKANPAESDKELGVKFYTAIDEIAGEENYQGELTIQQWGKVADKLEV